MSERADEIDEARLSKTLGPPEASQAEGRRMEIAALWGAEQLQQRHESERQRLNREQLDQLRTFRTQLVQELLSNLSVASEPASPANDPHGDQGYPQGPRLLPLSGEEAGQLQADLPLQTSADSPHLPVPHTHVQTRTEPGTPPDTTIRKSLFPPPSLPPSLTPSSPLPPPSISPDKSTHSPSAVHTISLSLPFPPSPPTHVSKTLPPPPPPPMTAPPASAPASEPSQPQEESLPLSSSSAKPSMETEEQHRSTHTSASPSPAHSMEFLHLPTPTLNQPRTPPPPALHSPYRVPARVSPAVHTPSLYSSTPAVQYTPPTLHGSLCPTSYYSMPLASAPSPASLARPGQSTGGQLAVKANLIEKHAKHVQDLKHYYETELAQLRASLELETEGKARQTGLTSTVKYSPREASRPKGLSSPFSSPLRHGSLTRGEEGDYRRLQAENTRLKSECVDLQRKLEHCNIEKRALEDRLKKHQQIWAEWQTQAESSFQMITVLQDRLESTRTQLQQQDSVVEQLQADLQTSVGEIQYWKEQRAQEADKLQQLLHEFEVLQKVNKSLQAGKASLQEELSQAHKDMKTSSEEYQMQEEQQRSTVMRLEEEVRHLQHINNRLHGQATHYTLGPSANTPDDAKLSHRPPSPPSSSLHTSLPPKVHTSPHTHSHTAKHPVTASSAKAHPPISTPHTSHPHTSHPHPSTENSKFVPLYRRKWLESSDPGLIMGTPPTDQSGSPHTLTPTATKHYPPHPLASPPLAHKRHAHLQTGDTESSPLLQSTGQSLMRLSQESGSSNEGEDPAITNSLSSRDNNTLVESTLTAIQSGRIKSQEESKATPPRQRHTGLLDQKEREERVQQGLRVVAEAEKRLAELQREKEMLESSLQRVPREGGRVTKHAKQTQLEMERRLDQVMAAIGSVRMTLRSHHALGK